MSSLPTDIWQVIVGFCHQKLMLREVCKQLSDELEYFVAWSHLPKKPIINFPTNFRVELRLNLYTYNEDLRQTGIDFRHFVSLNCQDNVYLQDDDLVLFKSLTIFYCGMSPYLTDKGLSYLKNLISLKWVSNSNFTDEGLVHLEKLEVLECGWNTNFSDKGIAHLKNLKILICEYNNNFTDFGLKFLQKLVTLDCGWNRKFTNDGISHLKSLEEIILNDDAENIDTRYNKDSFPFVEVDDPPYSKRVFKRVW